MRGGGLEIDYSIPSQLQEQTVRIWINGKTVLERTYKQGMDEKIIIPAEQLPDDIQGCFEIEIACSDSVVPAQIGLNNDTRELAICFQYIGEVR